MASATLLGSSGSTMPLGFPVSTAQNLQARVQMLPKIITVRVPWLQHSPTLGQRASWQTVWSLSSFTVAFRAWYLAPVGRVALSQAGLFRSTGSGRAWARPCFTTLSSTTSPVGARSSTVSNLGFTMILLYTGLHSENLGEGPHHPVLYLRHGNLAAQKPLQGGDPFPL